MSSPLSTTTKTRLLLLLSYFLLTCITCDIMSILPIGQNSLLIRARAFDLDQGSNNEAIAVILEGPTDKEVLLGEPTDLPCTFELSRNTDNVLPLWDRDGDYIFAHTHMNQLYWVANSSSLIGGATSELNSIAVNPGEDSTSSSPSTTTTTTTTINKLTNYSLHIKNASLEDDALFKCSVSFGSDRVANKSARLTVIKPPSELSVLAHSLTNDQSSPTTKTQLINQSKTVEAKPADSNDNSDELKLIVRQNSQLRLECQASEAKPHAQLVWLDDQQRRLSASSMNETTSNSLTAPGDNGTNFLLEELVFADSNEPKLVHSSLSLTFQVERHHSGRQFTCLAHHPAFERQQAWPQLYARELKRQIRLEVQYEPQVELTKDPSPVYENKSLTFYCEARGHPNVLSYKWFIDDQLIVNATEPKLRFSSVTRQLHMRDIKCQVTNVVGSSTAVHRLAVKYKPEFVSHLLVSSQQQTSADVFSEIVQSSPKTSGSHQKRRNQVGQTNFLARQLALSYEPGQSIELRCDFDSNPKVQQIQWFKVSTNYGDMRDVDHEQANELIKSGVVGAIFKQDSSKLELDYETMSEEILQELNEQQLADQQSPAILTSIASATAGQQLPYISGITTNSNSNSNNNIQYQNNVSKIIEPIASEPHGQLGAQIRELLDWTWIEPASSNIEALKNMSHIDNENIDDLGLEFEPIGQVKLIKYPNILSNQQAKFKHRDVQVTRSVITLRNANFDSMGKYVCRAKQQPLSSSSSSSSSSSDTVQLSQSNTKPSGYSSIGSNASASFSARAIFLSMKQAWSARIISGQDQWAPLGARELRVECLVQLSAQSSNRTRISWSKDGKVIKETVQQIESEEFLRKTSSSQAKNIKFIEEYSPDLLFIRSTLRIRGADFSDFGVYNCSIDSDSLAINLQPSAMTGLVFDTIASLSIATVIIFFSIVCLLIVFIPNWRFESTTKDMADSRILKTDNGNSHSSATNSSSGPGSSASSSSSGSGNESNSNNSDTERLNRQTKTTTQDSTVQSNQLDMVKTYLDHKMMAQNNQSGQQMNASGTDLYKTPTEPGRIKHEPISSNGHSERVISKKDSVSQLNTIDSSLLHRIWSKLLAKPANNLIGGSSTVSLVTESSPNNKGRPHISLPMNPSHQDGMSSGSRQALGSSFNSLNRPSVHHNHANGLNRRHNENISSQPMNANMAHDLANGSDGGTITTATTTNDSSRSSSSVGQLSAQMIHHHNQQQQQQLQQHQLHQQQIQLQQYHHQVHPFPSGQQSIEGNMWTPNGNFNPGHYSTNADYHHPSSVMAQGSHSSISANIYVNGSYEADPNVGFYQPDHVACSPQLAISVLPSQGPWQPTNNHDLIGHYQLPMMAPSDLSASIYQHLPFQGSQTSICTNGKLPPRLDPQIASNYATSPTKVADGGQFFMPQQQHPLVPTSDAGDAYFDSNYGTLISRSSKSLGYSTSYKNNNGSNNMNCNGVGPDSRDTRSSHYSTSKSPPKTINDTDLEASQSELNTLSNKFNGNHQTVHTIDVTDSNGVATNV